MAVLRTEDGRTLSRHDEINEIVRPAQIGTFQLPATIGTLLAELELPLTAAHADRILQTFDPAIDKALRANGFVHRRVGCLTRGDQANPRNKNMVSFATQPGRSGAMPVEMLKQYGMPHKLEADDCHHVYAGVLVKGMVLPDGMQVVIYVSAGEWIRLNKTTFNWPIFPYDGPNIAVSYFDRPAPAENDYQMEFDRNLAIRIAE